MIEYWKVNSDGGVNVRSGPNLASSRITVLDNNTIFSSNERGGVNYLWVNTDLGWICTTSDATIEGKSILTSISEDNMISTMNITESVMTINVDEESSGYQPAEYMIVSEVGSSLATTDNYTIRSMLGILGLPYQFLASADRRLLDEDGASLGRVYAQNIVSQIPALIMSPGKASFMTRYSTADKENMLSSIISKLTSSSNSSSLDELLTRDGRYYTLEIDHLSYFNYVNPMCRIASQYLGIGNYAFDGVALKNYNWGYGASLTPQSFLKTKLQQFFQVGLPGYTAFYIDSETDISESFSNSTTESMMANSVSTVSDLGREINFLTGYSQSALAVDLIATDPDVASSVQNTTDFISSILGNNNFARNLTSNLATVVKGGHLTFPEIWSDSSFSKSYSVKLKLVSPDCDKLSIYFNILVPLLHLIAYVAPQSIDANPNGYCSPFLVRAIYKGMFNVDMGIITSMNINKGSEGSWTRDGLPTEVEISFDIKDLYQALSITSMDNSITYDTLNNTALMDYIANSCGINIYKPELYRNIDMWYVQNVENKVKDITYNIFGTIEQNIMNKIVSLYSSGRN